MRLNNVAHWWTWNTPPSTGIVVLTILAVAPLFGWALAVGNWLVLGALIAMIMVPVVVRWPVVSTFGLYAFLVPFDSVAALPGGGVGGTLTQLVGLLAGGMLIVAGLMERRLGRPPLAALWWGLLVGWAAFSAMWAINPGHVFAQLPTMVSLFALYVTAVCIRPSRQELYGVCLLLVIAGSLAAAAAYFSGIEEYAARDEARGRLVIGDRASNPNLLGAALVLPFALAIGGFIGLRGAVQRAMAGGSVALIGLGIYISSRAAMLALIATIAVLFYRLRVRWQLLVSVLMLCALVATLPGALSTRYRQILTGEDASGSGRTEIWKVGLEAVKDFGMIGAGLNNFTEAYRIYVPSTPRRHAYGAINNYLAIWVDLGIVGLALMLVALGSQSLAVHKARKASRGGVVLAALEAGWFGLLVLLFFGNSIYISKIVWLSWILLTWATCCDEQSDQLTRKPGVVREDRPISYSYTAEQSAQATSPPQLSHPFLSDSRPRFASRP